MFVSGFLGFVLDNTIPGTREERGLVKWEAQMSLTTGEESSRASKCYDFPFGMKQIRR